MFPAPLNRVFRVLVETYVFFIDRTIVQGNKCNNLLDCALQLPSAFSGVFSALAQGMAGRPIDQAPEGSQHFNHYTVFPLFICQPSLVSEDEVSATLAGNLLWQIKMWLLLFLPKRCKSAGCLSVWLPLLLSTGVDGADSPQIWGVVQDCSLFPPSQSSLEKLQLLLSSETGKQKWLFFFKISVCHRGTCLKESASSRNGCSSFP